LKREELRLDFGAFIRELMRVKSIGLVCHHNADPDSLLSACVLKRILDSLKVKATIYAPADISELARKIMEELYDSEVNVLTDIKNIEENNALCLVDVSTLDQLSKELKDIILRKYRSKLFVIDHHTPHPDILKLVRAILIDPGACATGELVYMLAKEVNVRLDKRDIEALAVAILYDTKRFVIANRNVFKIMSEIFDMIDYNKLLSMFHKEMRIDEKIARLKAAIRARLFRTDIRGKEVVIALSHVSSYEASAARALLELGADLAIVSGGKKGVVRVCARCTRNFAELTNIHLGRDIMMKLGEEISGSGGGHALAASANGVGNPEEALTKALNILKMRIGVKLREIR